MEKQLYPAGGNAARDARFLSHWALKCQSGQAVLGSFWPANAGFGEIRPTLSLELRFRSSQAIAATSDANFGIKGALATY